MFFDHIFRLSPILTYSTSIFKRFKPKILISRRTLSAKFSKPWLLDDVIELILKDSTNNIVVLAGAGISTPSGVPDFRTPRTGLYDNLQEYNLPYAEAIFDIEYFYLDQQPFLKLAKEFYRENYKPNEAHYFIKLLNKKKKLLRMYTQNIDGLERLAEIPIEKLVEAHGTFSTASCIDCSHKYNATEIKMEILAGNVPRCQTKNCRGLIKPNIVFFGENLPDNFTLNRIDLPLSDLLIIMGTSLVVQPFASLVEMSNSQTPRLLINFEPAGSIGNRNTDVQALGDIVKTVKTIVDKLGWQKEFKEICQ